MVPVAPDSLFLWVVLHSEKIKAAAISPHVLRSKIAQAEGTFEPLLYNENRWNQTSDPVESILTTGGPPRLEDDIINSETGIRVQTRGGTSYNLGQRFGLKDSNSTFFEPNDQATSRLTLGVTQPLLRGRATDLNRTLLLTSKIETQEGESEYARVLQEQLSEVASVYWSLFFEHASRAQRVRHMKLAEEIVQVLQHRSNHDSVESQILRAQSAVANRRAELVTVDANIRNLESQLRSLVNAPELTSDRSTTVLPIEPPDVVSIDVSLDSEVEMALQLRPELRKTDSQIAAAMARLRLASDQTQTRFDLVGEVYSAGLRGNNNISDAFADQFAEGRPGFSAGIVMDRPSEGRGLRGAQRQRQLELHQLHHLKRELEENVRSEVETATRNVIASLHATNARRQSLSAAEKERDYLWDRWVTLGNDQKLGRIDLNELLEVQDRVLQQEQSLLSAMVEFSMALVELKKATGTLVQFVQEKR